MNTPILSDALAKSPPPLSDFLTQDQVAVKLQKTPRTIYEWRKLGLIPYVKLGGAVLFDPVAVARAIERLTVHVESAGQSRGARASSLPANTASEAA